MPARLHYIKPTASPIEILGIVGFGLLLSVFFQVENLMLFSTPALEANSSTDAIFMRMLLQLIVLAGMLLSYTVIKQTAHLTDFSKELSVPLRVLNALGLMLLLLVSFLDGVGLALPLVVWLVSALIFGFTLCFYIVNWLDICTRTKVYNMLFFVAASFLVGAVIVFINVLLPQFYFAGFAGACFLISLFLLRYISSRTHEISSKIKNVAYLNYRKEISVQYFAIAATLGVACALVWTQSDVVLTNLAALFVVVGAAVALLLSFWVRQYNIVPVLRALTFAVLLLAILAFFVNLPTLNGFILTIAFALWCLLTILNFSAIVNKCRAKNLSVIFHVPFGLSMRLGGFVFGWLAVLVAARIFDNNIDFKVLLLVFGIAAMAITLLVYPDSKRHHAVDMANFPASSNVDASSIDLSKLTKGKNEDANEGAKNLDKVLAMAQMYTLSVREIDVLRYLYKGRNASYIAKTLSISPHTAKSHIYRIYNKLNIHSQQGLIDAIDAFDLASRRPG